VLSAMRRAGVPEASADEMYRSLGSGVCELLAMLIFPRALLSRMRVDARALSLLGSGRGVVVATAHTGNWDLAACAAAQRVPLTVVTKSLRVAWLNRLWQGARRRRGVRLVGVGDAARAAGRALSGGEAVAMLIDQAPERQQAITIAPFLSERAAVDLAPALIAMRARVPLALVLARRLADGSHVAELVGVIQPPARASRAWAEHAMQTLTAWLDAWVRRWPEQWLWMHRRWKQVPESVVACERRWTTSRGETAPASRIAASP
jgi:KDO2-lipid IV(A) lauroyltransferase